MPISTCWISTNKLHLVFKNTDLPLQLSVQFYLHLISGFPLITLKTNTGLFCFPDYFMLFQVEVNFFFFSSSSYFFFSRKLRRSPVSIPHNEEVFISITKELENIDQGILFTTGLTVARILTDYLYKFMSSIISLIANRKKKLTCSI